MKILAPVALACATFASAAFAQTQPQWQVAPTDGGCAMLRIVDKDGGPAVMVNLSAKGESQLVLYVPGSGVEAGFIYTGIIDWDDKAFPVHFLSGGEPQMPALLLEAPNDALVNAVSRNEELYIGIPGAIESMTFPLTGAKAASDSLRQCVKDNAGK
jgi:hypothetical protein